MQRDTMTMLTLLGNLDSGNVHKVQLILRRLSLPYLRVEVSQVRGEPRRPKFLALNPIGKIPTLLLEDGDVLTESCAILYYFASQTPLWPSDQRRQTEVLRWMFFEQYSHEPTLAVLRYLRRFASEAERDPQRQRQLLPKARHALEVMEQRLTTSVWIATEGCTIADYCLYPYTSSAEESGLSLADFPAVRRWLEQLQAEPYFLPFGEEGAARVVSFTEYFAEG